MANHMKDTSSLGVRKQYLVFFSRMFQDHRDPPDRHDIASAQITSPPSCLFACPPATVILQRPNANVSFRFCVRVIISRGGAERGAQGSVRVGSDVGRRLATAAGICSVVKRQATQRFEGSGDTFSVESA